MKQQTEKIEESELLYNGEVNQLLGAGPSSLITKGSALLLILIASIGWLAWYIKIPDTIIGSTSLKSKQTTDVIISPEDITIKKIFRFNGDIVSSGDTLFTANNDSIVIKAKKAGRLLYLKQLKSGNIIKQATQVLAVLPLGQNVEVLTYVPIANYSRVKLGQKAITTIIGSDGLEKLTGRVEGLIVPKEGDEFGLVNIKLDQSSSKSMYDKPQILYAVKAFTLIVYGESSLINRLFSR